MVKNLFGEIKSKVLVCYGWIVYFFTRKKYTIIESEEFKEQLKDIPEEDQKMIQEFLEQLAKNPYIGRREDVN